MGEDQNASRKGVLEKTSWKARAWQAPQLSEPPRVAHFSLGFLLIPRGDWWGAGGGEQSPVLPPQFQTRSPNPKPQALGPRPVPPQGYHQTPRLTTENLPSPNHMTQRVPSAARLRPVIHQDTMRPGHQEKPRSFPHTSSPMPKPRPSWSPKEQKSLRGGHEALPP